MLYILYKSALLEFRFFHDTLQSTKFSTLQSQLLKFCIFTEFLDTKLLEKSNFFSSHEFLIKLSMSTCCTSCMSPGCLTQP